MKQSPFIGPDGEPRLIDCAVLFFDLLGVSAMAKGAKADYLTGAFQADPETELPEQLRAHREVVTKRLKQQRTHFRRWSKYRWVAEYHNATCFTYREVLKKHGGFEAFLIDSIHTKRNFTSLVPAGQE